MNIGLNIIARPMKRYIAVIIDGLLIGIVIFPVFLYSYSERLLQNEQFVLIFFLFLYKVVVYMIFDVLIPFVNNGRTIGRQIQHIKLVNKKGNKAQLRHYTVRAIIFIIIGLIGDVLLLGWLAYLLWTLVFVASIVLLYVHPHRRTVHDLLAGTMVVNDTRVIELDEED